MALVAGIVFAITLIPAQLEPSVTWIYSADGCEACSNQQVEMMLRYVRPGDRIFINFPDKDKALTKKWRTLFSQHCPGVVVATEAARFRDIVTGWIVWDPVTKEEVVYQSRAEKYGTFRAQTIMEIFRDPN